MGVWWVFGGRLVGLWYVCRRNVVGKPWVCGGRAVGVWCVWWVPGGRVVGIWWACGWCGVGVEWACGGRVVCVARGCAVAARWVCMGCVVGVRWVGAVRWPRPPAASGLPRFYLYSCGGGFYQAQHAEGRQFDPGWV